MKTLKLAEVVQHVTESERPQRVFLSPASRAFVVVPADAECLGTYSAECDDLGERLEEDLFSCLEKEE